MPFVFLTNGGFKTEKDKADHVSGQVYGFDSKVKLLKKEHIIQCHTIMQDDSIVGKYGNEFVLVSSESTQEVEICEAYGFKKVITL